jgi:hypothetical protein
VVELGRLAKLHSLESEADELLEDVRVLRLTSARLRAAKEIDPAQVRTLDSIHLSAAVSLHGRGTITTVLTFRDPAPGRLPAPRHFRRGASRLTKQSNLPSNIAQIARKCWKGGRNHNPRVGGSSPSSGI